MLVTAGTQLAPDRQRGAHARPVRRAGAPAARARWRRTSGGAGTPTPRACSASSIRCSGASSTTTRSRCSQQIPIDKLEERASQLALHSRINYAYRRMQEYLQLEAHVGRAARRRALGAAGRVLLGRVRPARVAADLLGRPRHPRRRSHQERVGSRHPAGRRRPVLRPGLLPAAARSRRLAARGLHRRRHRRAADPAGAAATARRSSISIETRTGTIVARVWQLSVGRNTLLLLDSNVDGNQPEDRELTARLYGGDQRVRIRQELLLGVGGVRALAALGISPGVVHLNEGHSAFAGARAGPPADGHRGHRRLGSDAPRRRRRSCSRRTRRCRPATTVSRPSSIEEHLGPLREVARPRRTISSWALGRVNPDDRGRRLLHDGAGAEDCRHRANAVSSLHGQVSRAMWTPLFPGRSEERVPIGHITNGVHVPTWLAPQMRQVYDRHLGPDWPQRAGDPGFWERDRRRSTTASCGRRTRR